MENYSKTDILSCQNEVLDELYHALALINAIKTSCQSKEFSGEYYGIPRDFASHLSDERNEYLSLLTLLNDKIMKIKTLNLCMENQLSYLK